MEESRRLHWVSLPFIPGSYSLVYSVVVDLLSEGVEGKRTRGRERWRI